MLDELSKRAKVIAFVIFGVAFAIFIVFTALKVSEPNMFCDGAPYLYATFHDEASNVFKYSRNGCLLDTEVLVGGPRHSISAHLVELRSLVFGQLDGNPVLYVADAYSDDSYLNIYGQCDKHGKREYITTAVSTLTDAGINHLYGIAFDQDGNLFVSSQHTDNVLRFYKDTFKPMPLPELMDQSNKGSFNYYPGTFIQFGEPNVHEIDEQGVRDVIIVDNKVWVANEDDNSVRIIDAITGLVEDTLSIETPIGLMYHAEYGMVFASSKGEKNQGLVYGISVADRSVMRQYKSKKMTHPTGMAYHGPTLFVANQKLGQIVTFNIHSGRFLKIIVDSMPPGIEKILISDC